MQSACPAPTCLPFLRRISKDRPPRRAGAAQPLGARRGRSRCSLMALQRLADRRERGKTRRAPIYLLSVRGFVLEHLFRRSQFVGYSTSSDEIGLEGFQALRRQEQSWHVAFGCRGLTLLMKKRLELMTIALTEGETVDAS